jgi:hypothetical protein
MTSIDADAHIMEGPDTLRHKRPEITSTAALSPLYKGRIVSSTLWMTRFTGARAD